MTHGGIAVREELHEEALLDVARHIRQFSEQSKKSVMLIL